MVKSTGSIKRVFADIEVSPNVGLFWGAGYKVSINPDAIVKERAIICVCWKIEGENSVHELHWDMKQNDRQLLIDFCKAIEDADEVIAHFGAGFDVPWMRGRLLFHGLPPFPLFKVIDTKAWAAKNFYFNSNKLDYLSKFLGSSGKIKTEWSWWYELTVNNCRSTLVKMIYYCKKDIIELEKVWKKLQPHCAAHVHAGVVAGKDSWTCPRTGSENVFLSKRRVTATGRVVYQMKNSSDGSYYQINGVQYEAYKKAKGLSPIRGASKKGNGSRNTR